MECDGNPKSKKPEDNNTGRTQENQQKTHLKGHASLQQIQGGYWDHQERHENRVDLTTDPWKWQYVWEYYRHRGHDHCDQIVLKKFFHKMFPLI